MEEAPKKPTQSGADRQSSVDSATYFEGGHEYDDYDDCGINNQGGGGGGKKTGTRRDNRGGGSGSVYSTKHTRLKEAQRETTNQSSKQGKK